MQKLSEIVDTELFLNQNLSRFMTIKLNFIGNLVICNSLKALEKTLSILKEEEIQFRVIGLGANQVLTNDKIFYIKLNFPELTEDYKTYSPSYIFSASTPISKMTSMALNLNLSGWECVTGIPGTIGGAVCMNAGTSLGEIGKLVKKVWVIDQEGNEKIYNLSENNFAYRRNLFLKENEIITKCKIENMGTNKETKKTIKQYLEKRNNTQPLQSKNCGSVFKNPSPTLRAGQLIDSLGLKGFGSEKLFISKKHANFIEHKGGASTHDFVELVNKVKDIVWKEKSIKFELEVKVD